MTPRLLAGLPSDGAAVALPAHLARWGELPAPDAAALVAELEASGLRGLGGASFPTWRKVAAVSAARRRPVVVANGAEGEPASAKDRVLLRRVPHLVLDGLSLAATALRAEAAVVVVGEGSRGEQETLQRALAERREARLDRVPARVAVVPDRFVAGEETAVVNALNGGPAKPTFVPPRPFERGVRGLPTLVLNVETLANVGLVARFGAGWFREAGTREEPGSVLVTISGAVERPGVYEAPLGLPLRDLLARAGGTGAPLSALLVGGYFGSWLPVDEVAGGVRLLESDLRTRGAALGARTFVALPEATCGVLETARVARYLAAESAGQCGPCVHGLAAVAGALDGLARCRGDSARLARQLAQITGRGACAHPDGAVRFVESARRTFAREFELHARGRCSGGGRPVLPVPVPSSA